MSKTAAVLCALLPIFATQVAARTSTDEFDAAAPKERVYRAAFQGIADVENYEVYDASLTTGKLKAAQPRILNKPGSLEVTLAEAGPEKTHVTITYTTVGGLAGLLEAPVAGITPRQVHQAMERRLAGTAPLKEVYPDIPDRLISPPPVFTREDRDVHTETVTATGSLDELREAMAKAVDQLGNEFPQPTESLQSSPAAYQVLGKDLDAGVVAFARETQWNRSGLDNRGRIRPVKTTAIDAAMFTVLAAPGDAVSRRVRITVSLDRPGDIMVGARERGQAQKQCQFLRDRFASLQPKTIGLGQTQEQVEAILGKPRQVINLGAKRILAYENLKITFVGGKVTDVQ